MKIHYFLLFLLFGCSKTDNKILEQAEFKDLIGTWTTDYPNDEVRKIVIHKNGKVEVFRSIERGDNFRISEFQYDYEKYIIGNDTLMIRMMYSMVNGKTEGSIIAYKKLYSDTAIFFGMGPYINDFEIDTNAIQRWFIRSN